MMKTNQTTVPVEDEGRWVGLVGISDARSIPILAWPTTTVAEIMTPLSELSSVSADEDADTALREMTEARQEQIPIVDRGEVRGFLRQQDILKWLTLRGPTPSH